MLKPFGAQYLVPIKATENAKDKTDQTEGDDGQQDLDF